MGDSRRRFGRPEQGAGPQSRPRATGCDVGWARSPIKSKMICDTTFLSDLHHERERGQVGPAMVFLAARRAQPFLVTVISAGEFAVIFPDQNHARLFLAHYRVLRLTPEIALAAAAVETEI